MVNMRAAHTLPFIIVVVLCAGACTTRLLYVEQDPGFTYSALADAGLGIGGVTSLVSGDQSRMEISSQMASRLRRALMEKRRDINVVPWGEIRRRLGDEEMSAGLQSFEEFGGLAGQRLSRWDARLQGSPRYVVLARVEEDTTSIDGSDHKEKINATRSVTVAFSIYDIRSGIRVWRADIEGELKNTSVHKDHDTVEAILEIIVGESRPPAKPPNSGAVIRDIFDRFAGEIPTPE